MKYSTSRVSASTWHSANGHHVWRQISPGVCPCRRFAQLQDLQSALFNKLNVQGDCHCVAHEQAAGFQSCVPGEAEVFPADPRRGRKPNSRISPRVLLRWARSLNIKNHVSVRSADRQVAANLQLPICVLLYGFRVEG